MEERRAKVKEETLALQAKLDVLQKELEDKSQVPKALHVFEKICADSYYLYVRRAGGACIGVS